MYGAGGQKRVADSFVAEYHFAEAPTDERENIAAFSTTKPLVSIG